MGGGGDDNIVVVGDGAAITGADNWGGQVRLIVRVKMLWTISRRTVVAAASNRWIVSNIAWSVATMD